VLVDHLVDGLHGPPIDAADGQKQKELVPVAARAAIDDRGQRARAISG